jgi:hypothetical protein
MLPLLMFSLFTLQGCVPHAAKKTPLTPAQESDKQSRMERLNACLHDADALVKVNSSYRYTVNNLYDQINSAKLYASISDDVSKNVNTTITPLYEYKINDACNNITQKLIYELKGRVKADNISTGVSK